MQVLPEPRAERKRGLRTAYVSCAQEYEDGEREAAATPHFCTSALRSALLGRDAAAAASSERCLGRGTKRPRLSVSVQLAPVAARKRRANSTSEGDASEGEGEHEGLADTSHKRKRLLVGEEAEAAATTTTTTTTPTATTSPPPTPTPAVAHVASCTSDESSWEFLLGACDAHSMCSCGEPLFAASQVAALFSRIYKWSSDEDDNSGPSYIS